MEKQQTKQKVKLRQTTTAQNKLTLYLDWSKENRRKVTHTTKFTGQGLAMLSGVLNSDKAIDVNIAIMRAFVMLRKMVLQHKEIIDRIDQLEASYDEKFAEVFKALKYLLEPPQTEREAIGFKRSN